MSCMAPSVDNLHPYPWATMDEDYDVVEVENSTEKGFSAVYRNKLALNGFKAQWKSDVRTLYDSFEAALKDYPDNNFLGRRTVNEDGSAGPYTWETYAQVAERRTNLGAGLRHCGVKKNDHIGIYSINRPEWLLAEHAGHAYSYCGIALYDTLGPDAVKFVLGHANITCVLCSANHVDALSEIAKDLKSFKVIVSFDKVTNAMRENAKKNKVQLVTIEEVEKMGKDKPVAHEPVHPDDPGTIMYTSGTTGQPKGVILTQKGFIAEVTGVRVHSNHFCKDDIHFSYLPLAHSFERAVTATITSLGGAIGFFQGKLPELINDIAELSPTFLVGAPRVWSRIYDRVMGMVNAGPPLKKKLFYKAYNTKIKALRAGKPLIRATPIFDKIVFKKTKARLGGRVRFILSGSAPLDSNLGEFLQAVFCCPVVQGYGLTENTAGAFIQTLNNHHKTNVGIPMPNVEMRLRDLPEMNYLSTDKPCPRGEVMLRGPIVLQGYYKNEEKTREVLGKDGWFATGDVGQVNPDGTLSIIDRAKNIFKLAQGEYVAAEYLEGVYGLAEVVQQIFVYGDSYKSHLVAVVVPNPDSLMAWAKKEGVEGELEAVCQDTKTKEKIIADLKAAGASRNVKGFEYIRSVYVDPVPFSPENDLLTPSFKLRRPQLKDHYKANIDAMYAEK